MLHVAHFTVERQAQGNDAHLHGLGENRLLGLVYVAKFAAQGELRYSKRISPSARLSTGTKATLLATWMRASAAKRSGSEPCARVDRRDPIAQTLEVFRASGAHYLLLATYGGASLVRAEPFDAIELELAAV